MSLEEYEKYLQFEGNTEEKADEALKFLKEHLEDLKKLLEINHNQLVLDPKVYEPTSKTASKTLQVNVGIFNQFTELCSTRFPHLRQKDLVSQSLLEFVQKYQKTLSE